MEPFNTSDLALATFLSLNGQSFQIQRSSENRGRADFVFSPVTDDEADDIDTLVTRFRSGQARVEPKRFMKEVGAVRGKLYEFLGVSHQSA